jgi:hypothetical protein
MIVVDERQGLRHRLAQAAHFHRRVVVCEVFPDG